MFYGFLLAIAVQLSSLKVATATELTYCEGHYGPGGDDASMSEPNREWCCVSCNCKDLSDKLPDSECPNTFTEQTITCPPGTKQIGEFGADIRGCGLEACEDRYQGDYPTIASCKSECEERTDCRTFTWAPMDSDVNHPDKSVCTLYAGIEPHADPWLSVSGEAEQIMCRILACPLGSTQIGAKNADIQGCGIEDPGNCDVRYQDSYPTVKSCLSGCLSDDNCESFTWAPQGGDPNHVPHSVCTLYDAIVPNQLWGKQVMCEPLECPVGSSQVGDLNADIGGCGLEGCDPRYNYEDIYACLEGCKDRSDCVAFNWSPLSGDQNHPNKEVCTLYNSDNPTSTWDYEQIFCKVDDGARRPIRGKPMRRRPKKSRKGSALFIDFTNGLVVDENGNASQGMMYMMYLVFVLLVLNLVCLTVWNCKKSDKRSKYALVSVNSDSEAIIQ
eukprot:407023_1